MPTYPIFYLLQGDYRFRALAGGGGDEFVLLVEILEFLVDLLGLSRESGNILHTVYVGIIFPDSLLNPD